jgi:hypothetical protein
MRSGILFTLALLFAGTAGATPWHDLGPRAMGMGGAGVAIAQGPEAAYWNPAGLGQLYNPSGFSIPFSARGEFTGTVLEGANDLFQISEACKKSGGAAAGICTDAEISRALDHLGSTGNGVMVDIAGGLAVKVKRVVVFTLNESYIGATPRVDRSRNTIATIADNRSALTLRGGMFTELGVGYGHEIKETGLMLGANLKGIIGKIGYNDFRVVSQDPGGGNLGKFKDNAKTSFMPAVDLGLLWDMRETWPDISGRPRLGLVGRNVNCPTFSQPAAARAAGDRDRFSLQGQARMGVAFSPASFWHLAGDLDLMENNTEVEGFKSRFLSVGTEVNLINQPAFNLPLRVGLKNNLAEASSGLTYTAGFGLNFLHVMLDVAGQVSAKRVDLRSAGKSEQIPSNFGGAFRFAMLFGGEDEGGRKAGKSQKAD